MSGGCIERKIATRMIPLSAWRVLGLAGVACLINWLNAESVEEVDIANPNLDIAPVRETSGLNLARGTWKYNCMECHRFLKARWHYTKPMAEHRDLELKHGNNRFCLNCHHPDNRNAFVDYDGSEIEQSNVVGLCAKCHGPQERDWRAGVHGRSNGFWNTAEGEKERLSCIQCHDPHDPAFKPMQPLAPPTYPARAPGGPVKHDHSHDEEDS